MEFIFIEDRNVETGHGWRDVPHVLEVDTRFEGRDGNVIARLIDEDGEPCRYAYRHAGFSYAWICPKEYYEQHKHLQDNIRTSHIKVHFPIFSGVDDMESHFEFRMTPEEMRRHLLRLGFSEVKK